MIAWLLLAVLVLCVGGALGYKMFTSYGKTAATVGETRCCQAIHDPELRWIACSDCNDYVPVCMTTGDERDCKNRYPGACTWDAQTRQCFNKKAISENYAKTVPCSMGGMQGKQCTNNRVPPYYDLAAQNATLEDLRKTSTASCMSTAHDNACSITGDPEFTKVAQQWMVAQGGDDRYLTSRAKALIHDHDESSALVAPF
jgi:hypothetical protein